MKKTFGIIMVCFSLIYLPLTTLLSFLLYQHVHATDLMWFLFWITIPLGFVTNLMAGIYKNMKD